MMSLGVIHYRGEFIFMKIRNFPIPGSQVVLQTNNRLLRIIKRLLPAINRLLRALAK